jgi:hypothetical protein
MLASIPSIVAAWLAPFPNPPDAADEAQRRDERGRSLPQHRQEEVDTMPPPILPPA